MTSFQHVHIGEEIEDVPPSTPSGYMMNELKKLIFEHVVWNDWKYVVDNCEIWPHLIGEKITNSGQTILHLAISNRHGKLEILEQLLVMCHDREVLMTGDEAGNTPLHVAASMGRRDMAMCLVDMGGWELIKSLNESNQTPLFVAAASGKKEIFLSLLSKCPPEEGIEYWRAKDGSCILHHAISGGYFDLAFQILKKCTRGMDNLGESASGGPGPSDGTATNKLRITDIMNERGQSPLHLLATKPTAFWSGSTLSSFSFLDLPKRFIYEWIKLQDCEERVEKSADKNASKQVKSPTNYKMLDLFPAKKRIPEWPIFGLEEKSKDVEGQNQSQQRWFPPIYQTFSDALMLILVVLAQVMQLALHFRFVHIQRLKKKKQKHRWAIQVMKELVSKASMWAYEPTAGFDPEDRGGLEDLIEDEGEKDSKVSDDPRKIDHLKKTPEAKIKAASGGKKKSPLLVAAMNGLEEMVGEILDVFPQAIEDVDEDGKNVVLLAVESRQPHVYNILKKRMSMIKSSETKVISMYHLSNAFTKVDDAGNSIRHLVARPSPRRSWMHISGAFLEMLLDIKWYQFVKGSMPSDLLAVENNDGRTAKQVFIATRKDMTEESRKWLASISTSCSVVAALTATAAFATVTTIPDKVEADPTLTVFAIASLTALTSSIASLIFFLAIIVYDYQKAPALTKQLIFGINSLIISIGSMLISFFASLSLQLHALLPNIAGFHIYAIPTCLLMALFIRVFLRLYEYIFLTYISRVPLRAYKRHVSLISSIS